MVRLPDDELNYRVTLRKKYVEFPGQTIATGATMYYLCT